MIRFVTIICCLKRCIAKCSVAFAICHPAFWIAGPHAAFDTLRFQLQRDLRFEGQLVELRRAIGHLLGCRLDCRASGPICGIARSTAAPRLPLDALHLELRAIIPHLTRCVGASGVRRGGH